MLTVVNLILYAQELTVSGVGSMKKIEEVEDHEEIFISEDEAVELIKKKVQVIIEKPCQCSCTPASTAESPEEDKFRVKEPLSAPF